MLLVHKPFHPHTSSLNQMSPSYKPHYSQSYSQQQHRRTPSAPATVIDVAPTKTPGLLTLSKPLHLQQHRQSKSKQPSASPPVILSTSPEKSRGRGNQSGHRENSAKSSSARPDRSNASKPKLRHKHSQSHGLGSRSGAHSRQPSPSRLPFPTESNLVDEQKEMTYPEIPKSDASFTIPNATATAKASNPTVSSSITPQRSAKRRNRHSTPLNMSTDSAAKQRHRETSPERSPPVAVPKNDASALEHAELPLSRSFPVMSSLASTKPSTPVRLALKRSFTEKEWDSFPICDDNETVHGSATVSPALSPAQLPATNTIESILAATEFSLPEPHTPIRESRTWQQEAFLNSRAAREINTQSDIDLSFSSSDNDLEDDNFNGPRTAPLNSRFEYFTSPSPSPNMQKIKDRKNGRNGRKEHVRAGSMPMSNFSPSLTASQEADKNKSNHGASSDNERGSGKNKRGATQVSIPQARRQQRRDGNKQSQPATISLASYSTSNLLSTVMPFNAATVSGSVIPMGTTPPPRPRMLSHTGGYPSSVSTSSIPTLGNVNIPASVGRARGKMMRSIQFNGAKAAADHINELYASSTFQNSPSPEALPPPSFSFSKTRRPGSNVTRSEGEDADDTMESEDGDTTF